MRRHEQKRQPERRGTMLVMFAVLLFALLPIASLVIQSGWLTLTRRQMQTGTDAAAVEALRMRDAEFDDDDECDSNRDCARAVLAAIYDDNLDASDGDSMNFGAGPTISFADGVGISFPDTSFTASRLIDGVGAYKPDLQLNTGDRSDGDIVGGTYGLVDRSTDPANPTVDPDQEPTIHREESDYDRYDFLDDGNNRSVLVRMRRTSESEIDNVLSSGPTVPFLFGRGPYGGPDLPLEPGEIDIMTYVEQGTPVRSTSIADAVPAWTVGARVVPTDSACDPESPDYDPDDDSCFSPIAGAGDFFIDASQWVERLDEWESGIALEVQQTGRIVLDDDSPPDEKTLIGWVFAEPNVLPSMSPLAIGGELTQINEALDPVNVTELQDYDQSFIPLAIQVPNSFDLDAAQASFDWDMLTIDEDDDDSESSWLICGFVSVRITGPEEGPWTVQRSVDTDANSISSYIPAVNTSASNLPSDIVNLSEQRRDACLFVFRLLADSDQFAPTLLHAPALRRAY